MSEGAAPTTRDRIAAAALAAFAERGVAGTSLDSVAASVGVRKQTLLYWFPSKDALLAGVIDAAVGELGSLLASAVAAAPSGLWPRVNAIVDATFRVGAVRPDLLVLLREVTREGPPASTHLATALEPMLSVSAGWLAAEGTVDEATARRVVLTAGAKVIGLATEVELLRDLGLEPDLAALRRRRRELLAYLRDALGAV